MDIQKSTIKNHPRMKAYNLRRKKGDNEEDNNGYDVRIKNFFTRPKLSEEANRRLAKIDC